MTFAWPFWLLISTGAAFALAYGVLYLRRPRSLARAAVKTGALAAWAAAFAATGRPSPLVLAFLFSALGDLALAFDKRWALAAGILAFLLAQLLYLLSFVGLWIMAVEQAPFWLRLAASGLVGLAALAYLLWLSPRLGWLALGVVPYAAAITAMTAMSFWIDWRAWPAMLGAILFMISDGLIAYELFRLPPEAPQRRWTAPAIWWSYIAAQALIALGMTLAFRVMA